MIHILKTFKLFFVFVLIYFSFNSYALELDDAYHQGLKDSKNNNYQQAINQFTQVIKEYQLITIPDYEVNVKYQNSLYLRGYNYFFYGNLDKSIEDLTQYIKLNSQSDLKHINMLIRAYNLRAQAYFLKGEKGKGQADLNLAKKIYLDCNQGFFDKLSCRFNF